MLDRIIISDSSPLIALSDIDELDLLQKLFDNIAITDIVMKEIHAELPSWISISLGYDQKQFQILSLELDPGEASAIALALEFPNSTIIIDESKGRSVAKRLGLKVIGTIGLIIKAKEMGLITSGTDILSKLEKHGFWMSEKLKSDIIFRLKE